MNNTQICNADVLIIGGGSAGLWAAYRISELRPDADILVVDKGPRDWGGLMAMAGGDFDAVLPGEDIAAWVEDFVYYFDGLCNQEHIETVLRHSYDRLHDYQKFGCEFFTLPDGKLKSVPQRGLPHVKLYPAKLKGRGGEMMVKNLVKQLKDRKVRRMGRILVTDLLKSGDRVCGGLGFDSIEGTPYRFHAQAVILATGMGGWKTSYGKNTPTGESMAMAYAAGATGRDFEFARVWNMPRYFGWEGQTTLMPLGARFINKRGESFMEKYSPVLGANTDPHYTTIAMALEIREGRGPIAFDISHINPDNMVLLRPQNGWQKLNYDKLAALGMDLFRDNTEWVPQMTVGYGGLRAGIDGSTNVPGLFAAGTARSTEPGVYAGGFALMTTSVSGWLAGGGVVDFLQGAEHVDATGVSSPAEATLFAPLGKTGLTPKEVVTRIQTAMFPYDVSIIKNEGALTRALRELERIQAEDVPRMGAADPHYLLKLYEARGMAFFSEMYLRASLLRQETRAGHGREDYPTRDTQRLAWLDVTQGADGSASFTWERVPLERYKHPVTRYYQDNFTFWNTDKP